MCKMFGTNGAVPNTSAFQQIRTTKVPLSGEHRQPISSTNTILLQTAGAESEMDVLQLDTCADVGYAAAINISASESTMEKDSNTRTRNPVESSEVKMLHISAADKTAESKAGKSIKKPCQSPQIFSTDKIVTIPKTSGSAVPGSTQGPKIVVIIT